MKSGLVVLLVSAGVLAGCGGSDPNEAKTPANASTGVNTAVQTDAKGNTVSTSAAPATTDAGPKIKTDPALVAAGLTVFGKNGCGGCHLNNGKEAGGPGPKLAAAAVTRERAETQITNGGGGMPAFGSLPPADYKAVVEYVLSLQ